MPKEVQVKVLIADGEMDVQIPLTFTGRDLFEQVARNIGLRETIFFGLQYINTSDDPQWLNLEKKVLCKDLKQQTPYRFEMKVKYFPENAAEDLIHPLTKKYVFLQTMDSIVKNEIYCPAETCLSLAACALQAHHGDYDSIQVENKIKPERLLPQRVITELGLSPKQLEDKILNLWQELVHTFREEAMVHFLGTVQELPMYGVEYFPFYNKKGTQLLFGVDALGIGIYEKTDKATPKVTLAWSECGSLSINGKKLIVQPSSGKGSDIVCICDNERQVKKMLSMCKGNLDIYTLRRCGGTADMEHMKAVSQQDMKARESDRQYLLRVKQARQNAEIKVKELETQVQELQKQVRAMKELETQVQELQNQVQAMNVLKAEVQELQNQVQCSQQATTNSLVLVQDMESKLDTAQLKIQDLEEVLGHTMKAKEETEAQRDAAKAEANLDRAEKETLMTKIQELNKEVDALKMAAASTARKETSVPKFQTLVQSNITSKAVESTPEEIPAADRFASTVAKFRGTGSQVINPTVKPIPQTNPKPASPLYTKATTEPGTPAVIQTNVGQNGAVSEPATAKVRRGGTKQRVDEFENM